MAGLASRIHQGSVPIGFRRAAVCFSACSLLILRAQKARQERDHSYCCEFDHTASLVLDLVRKPLFQVQDGVIELLLHAACSTWPRCRRNYKIAMPLI